MYTGVRLCSSKHDSFKFEDLTTSVIQKRKPKPDFNRLKFGHHFTDHMLTIDWTESKGWDKPRIHPLEDLKIHPASKVLHYAVELFEGIKAYRCVDGKIRLFRPMENMARMRNSAKRAGLPDFDGKELNKCIKKLVLVDGELLPRSDEVSFYIRPTLIGTEPTLGVSKTNSAKLYVLLGPVGPYFPTGFKPITLMADPQYVRSWPGGCGNFKMGSNYAPTIEIQSKAVEHGCQQVLWLYGEDHYMTEVGTMNLFVLWDNEKGEEELITPPLNGLILPGITRKSLLELARQWDEFIVTEKDMTMKEFTKALAERRIKEVFGAGTACIVSPVEAIKYLGQTLRIPTMKEGKLTNRFWKHLTDIQYGRCKHPWMEALDEEPPSLKEVARQW